MRIDYVYLKEMLDVFLDSDLPVVTWNDFKKQRVENDHKLVFHLEILQDKDLIVGSLTNDNLGVRGISDNYMVHIKPWRLSSDGHDFANSLNKPDILATIINNFKEQGLSIVIDVAKKVAVKKATQYLEQNT